MSREQAPVRRRDLTERVAAHAKVKSWKAGDFAVTVDSREQLPWLFGPTVHVEVKALAAGDYSVLGLEPFVAVERKSLSDFIGSTTHDHDRFKAELVKLRTYQFACVVVEASYEDVEAHRYRSTVAPSTLLQLAATISVKYVPVHFAGDAEQASRLGLRLLQKFWQHRRKEVRP